MAPEYLCGKRPCHEFNNAKERFESRPKGGDWHGPKKRRAGFAIILIELKDKAQK